MNKKTLLCITLLSFPLFSSCGRFSDTFHRLKESPTTRVSFSHGGGDLGSLTVADGGLMIYAVRDDEKLGRSLALLSEQETKTMTLPNGSYRFYGVSWDGPNQLEGQARCALANGGAFVALTGTPTTVNLTYNKTTCNFAVDSLFGPAEASAVGNFLPLNFTVCNDDPAPGCATDGTLTGSIRVVFEEFTGTDDILDINPNIIVAGCANVSGGFTGSSLLKVPPGSDMSAFPNIFITTVEVYDSVGCTGNLLREYEFNDGLNNPQGSPGVALANIDLGTSSKNTVYLFRDF